MIEHKGQSIYLIQEGIFYNLYKNYVFHENVRLDETVFLNIKNIIDLKNECLKMYGTSNEREALYL